ncbi:MAG: Bug family tripartite tricarboxylate transporter substrate binding protein [Burkholderiales bacterium]
MPLSPLTPMHSIFLWLTWMVIFSVSPSEKFIGVLDLASASNLKSATSDGWCFVHFIRTWNLLDARVDFTSEFHFWELRMCQVSLSLGFSRYLLVGLVLVACNALAQTYPVKPINLLSGASVGSAGDTAMRVVTARMSETIGQPIVVEARRGAGGMEAYAATAKAAPTGYTLMFANAGMVTNQYLRKGWPLDAQKDYTPIVQLFGSPYFLAAATTVPANNMKELVDYAKQNPGKLSYATTGIGSGAHLQGEAINMAAGTQMLHVPYAGNNSTMAVNDLITGRIDLYLADLTSFSQHAAVGKLKLIAFVDKARSRLRPDVGTINEVLPSAYNLVVWWGLLGPAGLPRPIVDRVNIEAGKALGDTTLTSKMSTLTVLPPNPAAPEDFARQIKSDVDNIGKVVTALGLKPE